MFYSVFDTFLFGMGGGGGRLAGEVVESAFGPSDEVKNVTTSFRVTKDVWHCKSLEGHMTKLRFR